MRGIASVLVLLGIATSSATPAAAQCTPSWLPTFGNAPGTDGFVHAMLAFDDGGGPALFVAGEFTTAGGLSANRIAKWIDPKKMTEPGE